MPRAKPGSEQEREIKKRKAAAIIKKKPEKIKDTEYLLLMDIMEDKLNKLKYVGENLLLFVGKNFKTDNKIKICQREISCNCILEYERDKDHFKIIKNNFDLIWDFSGFFGRNLHNIKFTESYYKSSNHKSENGFFELFEFMLKFREEFNNVFVLVTEGKRIYKNLQTKINKNNMNAVINNIDKVLEWYYANPRVDSATASLNNTIVQFSAKSNSFYRPDYYKPLFEKLATLIKDNTAYLNGELIVEIGKLKYKIEVSLAKHIFTNDCIPKIHIQKWLEPTGWVMMHYDTSLNSIFKRDKMKIIQKSEFDYNDYDHMIKQAINFINYFENSTIFGFNDLDSDFIKLDKYLV